MGSIKQFYGLQGRLLGFYPPSYFLNIIYDTGYKLEAQDSKTESTLKTAVLFHMKN
jgi:hypothetical protein